MKQVDITKRQNRIPALDGWYRSWYAKQHTPKEALISQGLERYTYGAHWDDLCKEGDEAIRQYANRRLNKVGYHITEEGYIYAIN